MGSMCVVFGFLVETERSQLGRRREANHHPAPPMPVLPSVSSPTTSTVSEISVPVLLIYRTSSMKLMKTGTSVIPNGFIMLRLSEILDKVAHQ